MDLSECRTRQLILCLAQGERELDRIFFLLAWLAFDEIHTHSPTHTHQLLALTQNSDGGWLQVREWRLFRSPSTSWSRVRWMLSKHGS